MWSHDQFTSCENGALRLDRRGDGISIYVQVNQREKYNNDSGRQTTWKCRFLQGIIRKGKECGIQVEGKVGHGNSLRVAADF